MEQILKIYQEITLLQSIQSVLYWDTNTMMPDLALHHRSKQNAYLSSKIQQLWKRIASELPATGDTRNYLLLKRQANISEAVPLELSTAISEQANTTLEVWKKAKAKQKFSVVEPEVSKLFKLNLQNANYIAKALKINDPFDALIATREPGMTAESIMKLFQQVKQAVVPLLQKIQTTEQIPPLNVQIPQENLQKIVYQIADFYHYEYGKVGRIDQIEHPLTIGCGPKDTRVTLNYQKKDFLRPVLAAHHELGHAIDRLESLQEPLPINFMRNPSVAEAYSRFNENKIGKSLEFWQYYYPIMQKTAPQLQNTPLSAFYNAVNNVTPGTSRMGADELTYLLHIIIRFEIENLLFHEKITMKEAPEVWNEKYLQYLNVEVPNDTEGIMQDLHWYSVYWGYFQGYALGDIYSSQIHHKLLQELPETTEQIRNGNFLPTKQWMTTHAYQLGARYDPLETIEVITDEPLTTTYHIDYLTKKYTQIYQL